jgi:CelD/BcsL family acetyltransferase involved in cellulose biosynthesis
VKVNEGLRIEVHEDASTFVELQPEWNGLLQRSGTNTIFLTWEWQRTWWDWYGEESRLCILAVRDGRELVGLAPLHAGSNSEGRGVLQLVGGTELSDYLDVIMVADGREAAVYGALWDFLSSEYGRAWDVLDLHNVPASSQTLEILPALSRASGKVEVKSVVEEVCPVINLPSSWDGYLASLNKKQRHEVRRKVSKASREANVRWYFVDDSESLDREVNEFILLHRKSGAGKDAFMDEKMQGFFREIAGVAFDRGWLRLASLIANDVKAASMFCFEFNKAFLVYNSGYDPDLYPSLSTGIVLLAHCIRDAIERGLQLFDFLRGEEEYKYRFGGVRTEIHNLRLTNGWSTSV